MWMLAGSFLLVALAFGLWLRVGIRARGGDVPCTTRLVHVAPVAIGVLGIFAMAIASGLCIAHFRLIDAGGFAFAVYLGAMSLAAILFIAAVSTSYVNHVAELWLRLEPPDTIIVRTKATRDTFKLEPASVRASFAGAAGGQTLVEYVVDTGARPLALVVSMGLRPPAALAGARVLARPTGYFVQGRPKDLHDLFAPFCAPHAIDGPA